MDFDVHTREKSEWCRLWWEHADDDAQPRVLVIGDSITAGYRPYVNELMKGKAYVDMYASSRAVNDPSYIKELKYVLDEYPYQAIHYNNGLHGWHETPETYRRGILIAVELLREKQPAAKLILATSTPMTMANNTQRINEEKDRIIRTRNAIACEVAADAQLPVNDLYALMLGKAEVRCADGAHYLEQGQLMQAEQVADLISRAAGWRK